MLNSWRGVLARLYWYGAGFLMQEYEFTQRAESEYTAKLCAKLGFTRSAESSGPTKVVASAKTVTVESTRQQQWQPQQEKERQQLDGMLARATRQLLWRGSICLHDFFSAVRDGACVDWVDTPGQVLRGCNFEACARSLAPKEWEAFQRCYAARLQLAISQTPGQSFEKDANCSASDEGRHRCSQVEDSVIASVRAECSRWLLPVDLGSGVVETTCRNILEQGVWQPFDDLISALQTHSLNYQTHVSAMQD